MNRIGVLAHLSLVACCLFLFACDSTKNRSGQGKAADPGSKKEANLQSSTIQIYEDGGRRLRVFDEDGNVITEGHLLDADSKVFQSRGLVAFTYNNQGRRLKTINHKGQDLHTDSNLLSEDSQIYISDNLLALTFENQGKRIRIINKDGTEIGTQVLLDADSQVWISENIIAFSAMSTRQGRLLKQDGPSQTYEAIPNGRRLYAYNHLGASLSTSSNILGDDSKVFVSKKIVAYTAHAIHAGKLMKEEGGTKTYQGVDGGLRLFAVSYLDTQLPTASEVLDNESSITVNDGFILMNVPNFVTGKLLKDEGGLKTYESLRAGRKQRVYLLDGTVR